MKESYLTNSETNFINDVSDYSTIKVIPIKTKKQNKKKKYNKLELLYNFLSGFFNSMIPFNFKFNKNIFYSTGLFEPLIICTIVSILISKLLLNYKITGKIKITYWSILLVSIIIYSFVFGVSFFNRFLLNLIIEKKLEYFSVLSIYAYSINIFIPLIILSYFIGSTGFILILMILGFLSLTFFIVKNLLVIMETKLPSYQRICLVIIQSILIGVSINLIILIPIHDFQNHGVKKVLS